MIAAVMIETYVYYSYSNGSSDGDPVTNYQWNVYPESQPFPVAYGPHAADVASSARYSVRFWRGSQQGPDLENLTV